MATLIKGIPLASERKQYIEERRAAMNARPGLLIIKTSNDKASEVYITKKIQMCQELGISHYVADVGENTSITHIIKVIQLYNRESWVTGIIVQLPLPKWLDTPENRELVIEAIDPAKDVDGLTRASKGAMYSGKPTFIPCTALAVMTLIHSQHSTVSGLNVCVIGRSDLVGRPVAWMCEQENATVTMCHSRTRDLVEHTTKADIIVVATGKPNTLTAQHVRPEQTIIDVGIHRTEEGKLFGDVDFESVEPIVGAITPVPGGVGPLTVISLMENVVRSMELRQAKQRGGFYI